jgi:acetolactate synthase-1/2/3 large subunit
MGVEGFYADRPEDVHSVIEQAVKVPGPALVHFVIPFADNVSPMVPAGESLESMIFPN